MRARLVCASGLWSGTALHRRPREGIPSSTGPWIRREKRTVLETWLYVLTLGQPLPTLPLWLSEVLVIPLNLEQSYEQACHDLWIA